MPQWLLQFLFDCPHLVGGVHFSLPGSRTLTSGLSKLCCWYLWAVGDKIWNLTFATNYCRFPPCDFHLVTGTPTTPQTSKSLINRLGVMGLVSKWFVGKEDPTDTNSVLPHCCWEGKQCTQHASRWAVLLGIVVWWEEKIKAPKSFIDDTFWPFFSTHDFVLPVWMRNQCIMIKSGALWWLLTREPSSSTCCFKAGIQKGQMPCTRWCTGLEQFLKVLPGNSQILYLSIFWLFL